GSSGCPAQVETRKRAGGCMVLALPAAPPRLRGKAGRGGNARIASLTGCPHPTLPRTRGREGPALGTIGVDNNPPPHAGEGVTRGMEGRARGGGSDAWRGRARTVP